MRAENLEPIVPDAMTLPPSSSRPVARTILRFVGQMGFLMALLIVVVLGWTRWMGSEELYIHAPVDDFVEYWAAGCLNVLGGDPYSGEQLFELQREVGWAKDVPLMMWNPPPALTIVMPFGLLPYAPRGCCGWGSMGWGWTLCQGRSWRDVGWKQL
jgi:hypothetical protein